MIRKFKSAYFFTFRNQRIHTIEMLDFDQPDLRAGEEIDLNGDVVGIFALIKNHHMFGTMRSWSVIVLPLLATAKPETTE